jgi:hypothetical protein
LFKSNVTESEKDFMVLAVLGIVVSIGAFAFVVGSWGSAKQSGETLDRIEASLESQRAAIEAQTAVLEAQLDELKRLAQAAESSAPNSRAA